MQRRLPVVAGQFYPSGKEQCVAEIKQCLREYPVSEELPVEIVSAIVPHAGWLFSGCLAAAAFAAIKKVHSDVDTFVIFGAAHSYYGASPAVYEEGSWVTPLGDIEIDSELAEKILGESAFSVADSDAHKYEHSIEVQVPFVQHLFEGAKILPILTPPVLDAINSGISVGKIISEVTNKKIVCIGSTDLTHYGPRYGFETMEVGPEAIEWASSVNDQKFIDAALEMDAQEMLSCAAKDHNACGAGAAAAAVTAANEQGKTKGVLLAHTNSYEIMLKKLGQSSEESVGYAAIIF